MQSQAFLTALVVSITVVKDVKTCDEIESVSKHNLKVIKKSPKDPRCFESIILKDDASGYWAQYTVSSEIIQ